MNSNTFLIKPKGVLWDQLSNAEQKEINQQMNRIVYDPQLKKYKFYKTTKYGWMIANIFAVPMKTKNQVL